MLAFFKERRKRKKKYIATKCGHETVQKGKVSGYGFETILEMPIQNDGTIEWCLECIGAMTIVCGWCKEPIFIGSPITLYSPVCEDDYEPPEHAHLYKEKPVTPVGCLRWDCADSGADRAGFWLPGEDGKGMVHRVLSPIERIMSSGGSVGVIVEDTHDIHEAHNPKTFSVSKT